ncbi:MAG: glyoxalase, partial [Flavobacterium sp.]
MKTRMIWANLAVSDLERTTKFYTNLGFKPNGTNGSNELVSFTFGNDNFIINFFTEERLKSGTKMELADLKLGNE